MSVDSAALERSALERKDREELQTIASALGGKPPSRAKKADIIDLILELTGVGAGGADAADDGSAAPAAADVPAPAPTSSADATPSAGDAPVADKATDKGTKPRSSSGRSRGSRRVSAGEPPAAWELEAADGDDGAPPAPGGGNGSATPNPSEGDVPAATGNEAGPATDSGNVRPGDADANATGSEGDSDDTGNRRRRRRGRNRGGDATPPEEFAGEPVEVSGYLDLRDEGYGFLRLHGFLPSRDDVYISVKQARQFGLRKGDHITGASRPALRNEKNPALLRIDTVNGLDPDAARDRRRFADLTPLFPDSKLVMERADDPTNMTARVIDLIAPIGKGQRGLIVSPPKAGKTTVMKQIVRSIEVNNPEVHLIVLLVDERPEEVTDMRRWLKNEQSMVVASTFDRPAEEHTAVAELAIERAKRLVEAGDDVVVVLDGITRLARAYNLSAPPSGRVMSGGIDTAALYPPKKFFGAARNVEEGGSLTILASALVETGSRMDEVIFEEFKGTGNMELRLDRRLAERRIYPAIDVEASSTRHEELLFLGTQLQQVWKLRRVLSGLSGETAGLELLIDRMQSFPTNAEFLKEIAKTSG